MALNYYKSLPKFDFRIPKSNFITVTTTIALGICLLVLALFILRHQFYFYRVVLAAILLLPIVICFLYYAPRRSLLGLMVLSIPFNPAFHLLAYPSVARPREITFYTSDLILIAILAYTFLSKILINGRRQKIDLSFFQLGLPLLLWIVAGAVSIVPATDKMLAIIQLVRMFRIFLIFFAIFSLVNKPEDIRFIATCLVIALAVQTMLIYAEYGLGSPLFRLPGGSREADMAGEILRPGGTMGHSSNFAKFAALGLPVCFAFLSVVHNNLKRIILGALLVGILAALVLTVSRAGIAASLFGLFCLFLVVIKNLEKKQKSSFILLIFLVSAIGFSWFLGGDRLLSRVLDDGGSALSRESMFSVAWNVIKHHPFLGIGLNNYTLIAPYYDQTPEVISILFPYPVHNIYLLYIAEMGIPGGLFFIWFLIATIKLAFKNYTPILSLKDMIIIKGIGIGIICSWLQGLVDWGFRPSIVHTSYLAALAGALLSVAYLKKQNPGENPSEG
jgi:putative inorganic carbon (HCO3(-)) transporter